MHSPTIRAICGPLQAMTFLKTPILERQNTPARTMRLAGEGLAEPRFPRLLGQTLPCGGDVASTDTAGTRMSELLVSNLRNLGASAFIDHCNVIFTFSQAFQRVQHRARFIQWSSK